MSSDTYEDRLLGQELRLIELQYPFHIFGLVSFKEPVKIDLNGLIQYKCPLFSLYDVGSLGGYSNVVISNTPLRQSSNSQYIFSGTTIINGRFVNGYNDLPNDFEPESIQGNVGYFSILDIKKDAISLSRDFLGFNHFFYYQSDSIFIVSNHYHLILEILNYIGICCRIDVRKSAVLLSTISLLLLANNFSNRMDMNNVFQLPFDKDIMLSSEGWTFINNSIIEVLNINSPYDELQYMEMIKEVKHEVINNVKTFVDDIRFKEIITDLSGGMDSRIVYAAVTNIESAREKVYINTTKGSENDIEIASAINNMYNYPFDNTPSTIEVLNPDYADKLLRSFFMGVYYAHNLIDHRCLSRSVMKLAGGCAEALLRPYFSRKFFNSPLKDIDNLKDFSDYISSTYSLNIITDYKKAFQFFDDYFIEELSNIPVKNSFEKFDFIYFIFRNSYHFDIRILSYTSGCSIWMPLQSKNLLRLRHMTTYTNFRSIKLQVDLSYQLNPLLASIRYADAADNTEIAQIYGTLLIEDNRYRNLSVNISPNIESWEKSVTEKRKNTAYIKHTHTEKGNSKIQGSNLADTIYTSLLENFKFLMKHEPKLKEMIGAALYYFIKSNNTNAKRIRQLYNKVTSLTDQIRIFNE